MKLRLSRFGSRAEERGTQETGGKTEEDHGAGIRLRLEGLTTETQSHTRKMARMRCSSRKTGCLPCDRVQKATAYRRQWWAKDTRDGAEATEAGKGERAVKTPALHTEQEGNEAETEDHNKSSVSSQFCRPGAYFSAGSLARNKTREIREP